MNASIVNYGEGHNIKKASTVSRKRRLAETKLYVRRENPVQNKFLRGARYFNRPNRKVYRKKRQKLKKKCKPCYICADWGHSGNFCPRVNICTVCSKEDSKNSDHTSIFCLKCGSTGHDMFSCTNDYDPEDLKDIQCYICMDFGHLCCTGDSTEGPSEASCYNCGQSGHHGFECPKMNAVANELRPVSICFKCQNGVHSPATWDLDNKLTSAKTITLEKDEVLDKSIKGKSRKTQAGELDNKLTSTETTTLEKDAVPDVSIKQKPQKAQIAELDNKSTSAETILLGKDAVLNKFVEKMSSKTQGREKVNKSTSAETSTMRKDAVSDKCIEGKSRKTQRKERRRKWKQVMPTSNIVQSLPTMSMIGSTIPRHGQYYENPGSDVWLPPPPAAKNCLVNSPALFQSTYGRPGLNVWLSLAGAPARNSLEIPPAVNQSSYQTSFHYHYNTNYREATHVPPNPFSPCSFRPHEIFHQGTRIPGPPQNMVQLPHQNFFHQIRTHVPRSTFESHMGISQQPEFPHHVYNNRIGSLFPHQKLQHQLQSHRTWMATPGWRPYY